LNKMSYSNKARRTGIVSAFVSTVWLSLAYLSIYIIPPSSIVLNTIYIAFWLVVLMNTVVFFILSRYVAINIVEILKREQAPISFCSTAMGVIFYIIGVFMNLPIHFINE
jgi:hypothetical protein